MHYATPSKLNPIAVFVFFTASKIKAALCLFAMRVPGFSPQNRTSSKFIFCDSTNTGHEPTSVLQQNLDHWDDLLPCNIDLDSIAKDLDLNDDSDLLDRKFDPPSTNFCLSDDNLAHGFGCFDDLNLFDDWGFDFVEDLIRLADCVDSNESQLAQLILVRLNLRLRSPSGKPLERAAFYFKEALIQVLSTESTRSTARISSWSEIVQTIQAYNTFAGISPILMFSHFTANQVILDSLINCKSSPPARSPTSVHVVDFDIGFGGQYASLMRVIAEKSETAVVQFLRVTAVVSEDYAAMESLLVKKTLAQFAQDLQIRFQIQFVTFQTFEMFSLKAIDFVDGEKTAVLLSPAILRRLDGISALLADLRRVSPRVVVLVDGEILTESFQTASFREELVNILEFYSLILESLDAAAVPGGDLVKRIETVLVRQKIFSAVEDSVTMRRVGTTWREALWSAGMKPVSLSRLADFQAEILLEKVPVAGFHVATRQAELVLCWYNRPLVATSAWRS